MNPLPLIQQRVKGCEGCHLRGGCGDKTPVAVEGRPGASIMFLMEQPGHNEIEEGRPFIGAAGKIVREEVRKRGVHSREVAFSHVVRCPTPKGKSPRVESIEACRTHLQLELAVIRPKVLVLCGAVALNAYRPDLKVTHHRGIPFLVDDWTVGIGTVNPHGCTGNGDKAKSLRRDLASDIKQAVARVRRGRLIDWPEECVVCKQGVAVYDPQGIAYCEEHAWKATVEVGTAGQLAML